jgi:hypothetical protein
VTGEPAANVVVLVLPWTINPDEVRLTVRVAGLYPATVSVTVTIPEFESACR